MKFPPWIFLLAVLGGCGASPPLHYYALDTSMPVSTVVHPANAPPLRVRHISLPPEMDHRGLTHHVGATQVAVEDSAQWTAPLGDLIQGTLTRDLGQRLGFDHVVAPAALPTGSRPDGIQSSLDLDFIALSADATCGVTAQVNWTLLLPGGQGQHGTLHTAATAAGCPAGLPGALSTALGDLADQLIPHLTAP